MLTCLQAIHNVCLVFFFFTFGTDLKLQNLFVERLKHIPRNIPPRAHRKDAPPDPTQRPAGDPSSTWPNSSPQTAPGEHRIWFHPSGPGPPSQPAPHQEARTASRSPSSQTQARSLGTAEHGEERRSPRRAQAMIERAALSRCSAPWEARPGEAFPSPERVEGGGNRRPGPGPHIPPAPDSPRNAGGRRPARGFSSPARPSSAASVATWAPTPSHGSPSPAAAAAAAVPSVTLARVALSAARYSARCGCGACALTSRVKEGQRPSRMRSSHGQLAEPASVRGAT